jgi:hypothetical protein
MTRVLRVARRSAMKARVAAAEQLYGVLYSAPEELRAPLLELKTKALVDACAAIGPGPLTSTTAATKTTKTTKTTKRSLARHWQQLQAELTQLDVPASGAGRCGPHAGGLPGSASTPAGQLLVTAGDNPQRLRGEPAFAHLYGAAPILASSGRTDQGLCRATDQPRPVQARHHALFAALHRPRGLPAPHKPATHRRYRLPRIGRHHAAHQHGHDGTERWHAACAAGTGLLGYWDASKASSLAWASAWAAWVAATVPPEEVRASSVRLPYQAVRPPTR